MRDLSKIEVFQDIQHHQRGKTLGVRRDLINRVTVVVRRYRLVPVPLVTGKILPGEIPAGSPHIMTNLLGNLPFIKSIPAALGQEPQRCGQLLLHKPAPCGRNRAAGKIDRRRFRG
ncbi:hypothetical protein D3C75_817910 [compost metagenome]